MDNDTKELLRELVGARQSAGVPADSAAAVSAARRERERDPNRTDPKHTQDRMDAAVHKLRVDMGLERA